MKCSARNWFFIGFLACLAMLLAAGYFQFVKNLEPCPLCISQRVLVLVVGIIFLIAVLHNPKSYGIKTYSIIGLITALLGASVSGRHVWLQNLPPEEVPSCGPGLEYVFKHFPLSKTIELLLSGTGECAEILWTFLGLSIPAWTFVAFILLAAVNIAQFWNAQPQ